MTTASQWSVATSGKVMYEPPDDGAPCSEGSSVMPPIFAHGRLRLYLLKLLDEAPRHGYEIIRLLEERFQGRYVPSAGTVYPRLAKLESEGLVTHTTEGGRKVYALTDAGRAELADRCGELVDLEVEIGDSVAELVAEIRADVGAARRARFSGGTDRDTPPPQHGSADADAWQRAGEELRRAKEEWQEQARRAREESRRARQDAQRARRQAREAEDFAREEVQRVLQRLQEQAREHLRAGDWQRAVREGLAEVSRGMNRISRQGSPAADRAGAMGWTTGSSTGDRRSRPTGTDGGPEAGESAAQSEPDWAREFRPSGDPGRDLDRLLDRFRDGIRDTARDLGVTDHALAEARRQLAATAARIDVLLRGEAGSR